MRALVRRPGPLLAEGIVTHIDRRPVDLAIAQGQWESYVSALESSGWETVEVAPADDCPDSVFVEDTLVVYGELAVVARPAIEARRPELDAAERAVAGLGYSIARITPPGTLDGGDVLKVGTTVYVGRSSRTNDDGVRQLRSLLEPRGASVVTVAVRTVLHLKSAVTALPDGSIVGCPSLVDDHGAFPGLIRMPEESGGHVVLLGGGKLLIAADCPRSAELLSRLGYEPIEVDIGEFQKLEGCVTCLSVRLRTAPAIRT